MVLSLLQRNVATKVSQNAPILYGYTSRQIPKKEDGLNGGSTCRLSVKISLLCRFSVKIFDICRLSVNLS